MHFVQFVDESFRFRDGLIAILGGSIRADLAGEFGTPQEQGAAHEDPKRAVLR